MKKYWLLALVGFTLVTPSLVAQTKVTAPTPIPEEARKHFVMGTTLFKDAKTPDDYAQVEGQFKQAVDLAPQWPDARYNLALSKEAAGDYSGAMADLKLYQQFKLSDTEARTVQDKIYELEAKQAKKVSDGAAQAAAEAARAPHFDGTWDWVENGHPLTQWNFTISGPHSAQISDLLGTPTNLNGFVLKGHNNQLRDFKTNGRRVTFRVTANYQLWAPSLGNNGYYTFNDVSYDFDLTLSDDGQSMNGTYSLRTTATNQISFARR